MDQIQINDDIASIIKSFQEEGYSFLAAVTAINKATLNSLEHEVGYDEATVIVAEAATDAIQEFRDC